MEYSAYLKSGLERYFDIKENFKLGHHEFDMFANYNQRSAKYMLMKKYEMYAFKNNEYIFHKKINGDFTDEHLKWLNEFYKYHVDDIVTFDSEHMQSTITIIFECKMPSQEIIKKISKFKYYKSYSFGLKGWVNGKVLLIDPNLNDGIGNKLGQKDLKRFLQN